MLPVVPEQYSVRVSQRAKRIRLRVSSRRGLEVIIPPGLDPAEIPGILHTHQRWLQRAFQSLPPPPPEPPLPERIQLPALNREWEVIYGARQAHLSQTLPTAKTVCIPAELHQRETCYRHLQQWLSHQGKLHLPPWLQQISQECGLPFQGVTIRGQKTRWGSCSPRGSISLNYKLLLLPAPLVRYVLIHELCHTAHLDHSVRFWRLVHHHEPQYRQLRAELRQIQRHLPAWASRENS